MSSKMGPTSPQNLSKIFSRWGGLGEDFGPKRCTAIPYKNNYLEILTWDLKNALFIHFYNTFLVFWIPLTKSPQIEGQEIDTNIFCGPKMDSKMGHFGDHFGDHFGTHFGIHFWIIFGSRFCNQVALLFFISTSSSTSCRDLKKNKIAISNCQQWDLKIFKNMISSFWEMW